MTFYEVVVLLCTGLMVTTHNQRLKNYYVSNTNMTTDHSLFRRFVGDGASQRDLGRARGQGEGVGAVVDAAPTVSRLLTTGGAVTVEGGQARPVALTI